MMSFRPIAASEVTDPDTLARYAQQTIGTKIPNGKEIVLMRTRCKRFFEEYPTADFSTLVHTIDYIRAKRKRVAMPWAVFAFVPWAYKDGFLPELDPRNHVVVDGHVEGQIHWILERETDPWWVNAFTYAVGVDTRKRLLGQYWAEKAEARA
jgi:hypothetical protein